MSVLLPLIQRESISPEAMHEHIFFLFPFVQVTLLGFSGTLKWKKSPDKGLLISLPYIAPSVLPMQLGWTLRLEGVK